MSIYEILEDIFSGNINLHIVNVYYRKNVPNKKMICGILNGLLLCFVLDCLTEVLSMKKDKENPWFEYLPKEYHLQYYILEKQDWKSFTKFWFLCIFFYYWYFWHFWKKYHSLFNWTWEDWKNCFRFLLENKDQKPHWWNIIFTNEIFSK